MALGYNPYIKQGGYETQDDSSPKSQRRAAAMAGMTYVARAVVVSADGDITVTREDGTSDTVWCTTGWNPIRFVALTADAGAIVKDVHF